MTLASPSGGPGGSKTLPWDVFNILATGTVRPAAVGLAAASVCAKDVATVFRPGAGISGTANVLDAKIWCVVGRPRSDRHNVAGDRKFARHMRLPSARGEPAAAQKLVARNTAMWNAMLSLPLPVPSLPAVMMIRIRGHAAEIFLLLFVTGLAVTKRCVRLAAARLVTAVTIAARTCGACWIVNVSGWLVTAPRDDSSVSSNIRPNVAEEVLVPPSVVSRP